MKELKKLSLKEEIDKQAEKTEKEVRENKEIEDMKVSEDMETSLFSRIQEYEYDKRIKKVYRRKKKRMIIVAFAAVLVLALGSMITGVGSRSYWRVLWDELNGDETASGIDVEDMDSQETDDIDELNVAEFNDELAKDAILRKLNYAQGIVNSRLQKEGNKVLEEFGKLFIKVCATDACDLGVEQVDSFVFADDAFKNEENTDIGLIYADQVTGKTYDFTIARSCNALRDVVANITALNNFQNEDGVYNKDYNDLVLETINLFKLMLGNDYKADNRKIKAEFNNREVANNLYQLVLKPED